MGKQLPITNNVRKLRESMDSPMTQSELGALVGVTRQTIAAIENRHYSPSLETAFRIARTFDLTVDAIFVWDDSGD